MGSCCYQGSPRVSFGSLNVTGFSNGPNRTPLENVQAFIRDFIKIYRGHGGEVHNTTPVIHQNVTDGGKAVENLFTTVGNTNQFRPQIMFFILPTKNVDMYTRIKKSADCRYGVVSQCVQANHVMKNQPQYHSNLAMKVNAKLGGTTCRVNLVSSHPGLTPCDLGLI